MLHTGRELLKWSAEADAGVKSFSSSILSSSRSLLLPYYGMLVERAMTAANGFVFSAADCATQMIKTCAANEAPRCDACAGKQKKGKVYIAKQHKPRVELADRKTNIRYIAGNPELAEMEIRFLRGYIDKLKRENAKKVFVSDLEKIGIKLKGKRLARVVKAVDMMDGEIVKRLEESGDTEHLELWQIHREHLNATYEKGGKKKGRAVPVHPVLMSWAIGFLASTSATVYQKVAQVMMLPNIRYVQQKSAELVSRSSDKAVSLHRKTMQRMKEQYGSGIGVLSLDSANANPGFKHDVVSNTLKGGCESHKLSQLAQMFHGIAESVENANKDLPSFEEEDAQNAQQSKSGVLLFHVCINVPTSPYLCTCFPAYYSDFLCMIQLRLNLLLPSLIAFGLQKST